MIGGLELVVVLLVALLLFGGERLPELANNLGRAVAEFRKASDKLVEAVDLGGKEKKGKKKKLAG